MALVLTLGVFLGVCFLGAFVAFAAMCVGRGDPIEDDFDHGGAP